MNSRPITRKDFILLTFTLVGSATVAASCGSSSPGTGGEGGSGGSAGGGSGGAGGSGGSGAGGAGGGNADASTDQGSTLDATTAACSEPLPETQTTNNTHFHSVAILASTVDATSDQTFTTSTGGSDDHTHMITLTVANLGTLKGGGTVTVTSTTDDYHNHMYQIGCRRA
jgi:hypothetical protein